MAHAQAAGDREGQAVSARRAAARDPRGRARIGDAMGRVMLFDGPERFRQRRPRFPARSGTGWFSGESRLSRPTPTARSMSGCTTPTARSIRRPALGVMKAGPGGTVRPGLQGQGRQPPRRRQVVPPARARERAGRGLLVADAVRLLRPAP